MCIYTHIHILNIYGKNFPEGIKNYNKWHCSLIETKSIFKNIHGANQISK